MDVIDMASDPKTIIAHWFSGFRGERGIPANLPRAQLLIEKLRKNGFVIVPTGESVPAKRLYDALSAMMYGWEDDDTRLEAFAALKEAEPFIHRPCSRLHSAL